MRINRCTDLIQAAHLIHVTPDHIDHSWVELVKLVVETVGRTGIAVAHDRAKLAFDRSMIAITRAVGTPFTVIWIVRTRFCAVFTVCTSINGWYIAMRVRGTEVVP
jgi:hypothetical protein